VKVLVRVKKHYKKDYVFKMVRNYKEDIFGFDFPVSALVLNSGPVDQLKLDTIMDSPSIIVVCFNDTELSTIPFQSVLYMPEPIVGGNPLDKKSKLKENKVRF